MTNWLYPDGSRESAPGTWPFGWALVNLKKGYPMRRAAWRPRDGRPGTWLQLALPHVLVCGPSARPVWLEHFTIQDVLAEDWEFADRDEEGEENV